MKFSRTWYHPAQLEFVFEFALPSLALVAMDDDEEDDAFYYPVHTIVSAAERPAPVTRAPRSVFDLAAFAIPVRRQAAAKPSEAQRYIARVEIADGVTRCLGAAYPSRWTPEDEERDRLRRARQRPPRPPKKAKTRSKKLLELVGEDG